MAAREMDLSSFEDADKILLIAFAAGVYLPKTISFYNNHSEEIKAKLSEGDVNDGGEHPQHEPTIDPADVAAGINLEEPPGEAGPNGSAPADAEPNDAG